MIDTIGAMLDLPRDERSKYLSRIPLTRTYVFGALEPWHIRHIRRVITRNGGVYREGYRYPGVYWVSTFRTHSGMTRASRELAEWLNRDIRQSNELNACLSEEELQDLLYDPITFGAETRDVPTLGFLVDVWIQEPRRMYRPNHPIRGN